MNRNKTRDIRLTQYSHGAGCGCKIAPKVLEDILRTEFKLPAESRLIVGNDSRDDAAVYDTGSGTAVISTTDFFMPIVDDPFDFGRIASANAISDVYAMGGTPLMAISILGWPVDKLPAEAAREVLEGSRSVCSEAGIALAGGHSIDSPEPIFGLAVTGTVPVAKLKRNDTARPGDRLYLTKPLGVGILSTARKMGILKNGHERTARDTMIKLNRLGELLRDLEGVHALTDVTGFGLLGHLSEICRGSGTSAEIDFEAVPLLSGLDEYLESECVPGGTHRNWDSYGDSVGPLDERVRLLLCDPQTSGGLLASVGPEAVNAYHELTEKVDLPDYARRPIGRLHRKNEDRATFIKIHLH